MFSELETYTFDVQSVNYPEDVRSEIRHAQETVRQLQRTSPRWFFRYSEKRAISIGLSSDDEVEREQACWELVEYSPVALRTVLKSLSGAKSSATAASILLAARKVAWQDPPLYLSTLRTLRDDTSDQSLREWALLSLQEHEYLLTGDASVFDVPCVEGDCVAIEGRTFDVTVPLIFECTAEIRIGKHSLRLKLSPAYFQQAIGHAVACLRRSTFDSMLILEKTIDGIHRDGSPHFEHFPFSGTTTMVGRSLYHHNYWANIRRPYYTSNRTESVSPQHPVIPEVPMTFARLAMTTAPQRYTTADGPAPESVRGVFFGFGHIPPWQVLRRGFQLKAGDFQITGHRNPQTGEPANTRFFGTFYGKLGDRDATGRIVLNGRATHCTTRGILDYHGDGAMMQDPLRPSDWSRSAAVE